MYNIFYIILVLKKSFYFSVTFDGKFTLLVIALQLKAI